MKKATALFLALIMLFGMAVPAFAADEGTPLPEDTVTAEDPSLPGDETPLEQTPDDETPDEGQQPPDGETPDEGQQTPDEGQQTPPAETTSDPGQAPDVPQEVPGDEETGSSGALDTEENTEGEQDEGEAAEDGEEPEEYAEAPVEEPAVASWDGQVDVIILRALDLGSRTPSFTVSLSDETEKVVGFDEADFDERVSFKNLTPGTYTLTVKGLGFATYTQKLTVESSKGMLLELTAGEIVYGEEYGEDDAARRYGVLRIGDVNGDGYVDGDDATMLWQAIDGEAVEADVTDLNGDGRTDLADMEYLARGMAAVETTADPSYFIPLSAIAPAVSEGTKVDGDLDNLLQDNGAGVTLASANDEAISAENPVEVSFAVADAQTEEIKIKTADITDGVITIETDEGVIPPLPFGASSIRTMAAIALYSTPTVTVDENGNITVDLGGQVAVKKVTLTITGTKNSSNNLAEISQVEFLNGMEERIPEPALDKPLNVTAVPGSKEFTVSWSPCTNITGYEVEIILGEKSEIVALTGTSLTVTTFGGEEIRNYSEFYVHVRSVNGAWFSEWSDSVKAKPMPSSRPDKPDMVTATGGFQSVTVSWKDMKDTESYSVYYKEESAADYTLAVEKLTGTRYTITGLDSSKPTTYVVYVVGVNGLGASDPSITASATTTTLQPPEMPKYKLINRDADGKPGTTHIVSVTRNKGEMVDSELDAGSDTTAWGTVDGDGGSYYTKQTWDDGGYNGSLGTNVGVTYTFDQAYELNTISLMSFNDMDCTYVKVRVRDEAGNTILFANSGNPDKTLTVQTRRDSNGKAYYFIKLSEPVKAKSVQIGVARYWAGNNQISLAEVYFYHYDSVEDDLMALYADDLHLTLVDGVKKTQLDELKKRIESTDEFGNPHPDKDRLLKEWETAYALLMDELLSQRVTTIYPGITTSDTNRGFSGLNAWQPLGVTAGAGEEITVYVSHNSKAAGENTNLQLVVTQYHAEASAMSTVVRQNLVVGVNTITIPPVWNTTQYESGGALYIQYTGGNSNDRYAVRVSGGVQVPVLNLYRVTDEGEKLSRATAYLDELQAYVSNMGSTHNEKHQGGAKSVDLPYDAQNCILGATDILLDTMMLSLPASQILAGCGGDAQTLVTSMNAMESMMGLFYQHKGLNNSAPNAIDRIPSRHLNIRYQRMFSGAFMYASGDHIGIGWDETAGMVNSSGVQATADGLYQSGSYFGWGIAHEIGHDINQNVYALAEVTNNYFSVLAQAQDTNDSVRFSYDNVYAKVTSGVKGNASNVFTQLGMYWQLHLAYDTGYNFATYADYNTQLANLFYARVDTYARTPSKAPGGLNLTGADRDQAIMRLACAAAEKNLLDFFERWGKTPDAATVAYASQFPAETRAIYYVCDDSRRYTIEQGGTSSLSSDGSTAAISSATAAVDPNQANQVNITIIPDTAVVGDDAILGYEIVRCTISGGQVERKTVAFTTDSSFADVVSAMNNRAVYYEVTLVDKYLNRSAVQTTAMVKIEHKGNLDKTNWTVTTTGLDSTPFQGENTPAGPDMPCEPTKEDVSLRMIDGKVETEYLATVGSGAMIALQFGSTQVITGFEYTAGTSENSIPIKGYQARILTPDGKMISVGEGTLDGSKTVYFSNGDGAYVSTYEADALYLYFTGQTAGDLISVAELDVLGVTGDNVDFRRADGSGTAAIGYLGADFQYASGETIPAGSLVFTGSYKGNAAYNVVLLFDQDGNNVGGIDAEGNLKAYQIILADVPATGNIQDVTDGTWIYWIEPGDLTGGFTMPQKVRAELYRVNDAVTNEGQRLVSDSLFETVPETLPTITLG